MKQGHNTQHWASAFYEYAFTPVPPHERKPTANVLIVTMGYTVALSCFVIGTKVGYALPFWQAVGACIAGNLVLMVIGICMGIMGFDSGWSTAFLVRQLFGRRASGLVSLLILFLSIYWVGMNGDSFAHMIVTIFPRWQVPVAVTAVILVAIWGVTAAFGWRGLTMASWIFTPPAVILTTAGIVILFTRIDAVQAIRSFIPAGNLTITAAIAAVTGNYIFGSIISPDLCRFAKSRKAVIQVIVPAYTVGFILLNICGVFIAQLGNTNNFGTGVVKLGLALPYLICAALGLWTTENYNIYGGSLAAQNLFLGTIVEGNLSHKIISWIIAGLAAAFAALEASNYLMPIITLIAALVPPIAGVMFSEYFIFHRNKTQDKQCGGHWVWAPAWMIGSAVGIWSFYEQFLISPVMAMLTAGMVYIILRVIVGRKKI